MNTPEEHAAAVLRAPGQITVASIAGAIRAYANEIKGSQIADADKLAAVTAERDAALAELNRVTEHYHATMDRLEKEAMPGLDLLISQRDAERTARKALAEALEAAGKRCESLHHKFSDRHGALDPCPVEARIAAALELAAKLI